MKRYLIVLASCLILINILVVFKDEFLSTYSFFTQKSDLESNNDMVCFLIVFYFYLISVFIILAKIHLFDSKSKIESIDGFSDDINFDKFSIKLE